MPVGLSVKGLLFASGNYEIKERLASVADKDDSKKSTLL